MHSIDFRRGAVALVALAIPLAACGSSHDGSNSSSGAAAGQPVSSSTNKALAFSRCMRAHGVPNFPDLGSNGKLNLQIQVQGDNTSVNGVEVNAPAFRTAMNDCRSYLPNGGQPPPMTAARKQAMLRFAQCMRSHGVPNFPDPTFQGGRSLLKLSPGSGIDPQSPSFKAAQRACGSALKSAGGSVVAGGG